MTTIAIFSTYAPSESFGGPARIFHERRVLEAAGHDVIHVVLQAQYDSGSIRAQDFVRVIERPYRSPIDHIYHDVDMGHRAAADKSLVRAVIDHLAARGTAVILLEQPFLVEVVTDVASALRVPVIYSSQNVEHRLRADLERFQFDWKRPLDRAEEVRQLEAAAVALASHVTTICPSDRRAHRDEFGCESTLVPNGSSIGDLITRQSVGGTVRPAAQRFDFVFAGSAYWPNVDGFVQIATPSLAFLPPMSRIGVAGSVCSGLLEASGLSRHLALNRSRLELLGFLPARDLADLMAAAGCVIVPIFIGEGSNLKSADALACGAPVIMSERATHGYEDVLQADSRGVTVVHSAREFRSAMRRSLEQPLERDGAGTDRAGLLRWATRLQPLVEVVRSVTAERNG